MDELVDAMRDNRLLAKEEAEFMMEVLYLDHQLWVMRFHSHSA